MSVFRNLQEREREVSQDDGKRKREEGLYHVPIVLEDAASIVGALLDLPSKPLWAGIDRENRSCCKKNAQRQKEETSISSKRCWNKKA